MIKLDNNFIQSCIKGERKAQMQLYSAFYKRVYNSCYRILWNNYEAEDAMQESFIKIFSKLDLYEDNIPFEAWITRIAINTAIDKLRENKLEIVELKEAMTGDIEDTDENEDMEDISNKVEKIKNAIQGLPGIARIIMNLYLFEGYDHEEIAEILNITPGNSRIQFMRAKKKITELISSEK